MNPLLQSFVPSLAWALLDFVWQGFLVGWAAALALTALRGARPQLRYAVACGALLLCAALPLSGVVLRMQEGQASSSTTLAPMIKQLDDQQGRLSFDQPAHGSTVNDTSSPLTLASAQLSAWQSALRPRLSLVVLVWCSGAALLALRMVLGLLWVRRLSTGAGRPSDQAWQTRLQSMARRLDITRPIALGLVDDVPGPVTAGWWRPVVLLPAALITRMPAELLEALLAHELAHIKRHDYLVNLVQSAIEIVLFYHPTVWWLSGRIRVEREQIADDLAASMLGEPRRLALALTELDQFQFTTPRLAHAAHGGHLMSRIKRLVRPDSEPLNWKMAVPILGLCAFGAAFLAHADTSATSSGSKEAASIASTQQASTLPAPTDSLNPGTASMPDGSVAATTVTARPGADGDEADADPAPPAPPAPPSLSVGPPPVPPVPPVPDSVAPVPPVPPVAPVAPLKPLKPIKPIKPMKGDRDLTIRDSDQESYAVVRGDKSINMSGRSRDLRDVEAMKRSAGDHFLWFRNEGKAYIVQDATVLAKVDQAWAPVDKLGKQMDAYGKEMDEHGKVMDALGQQMDAVSRQFDSSAMRREADKTRPIAREQRTLSRDLAKAASRAQTAKTDAERDAAQQDVAKLEAKMEELEKRMEKVQQGMEAEHANLEKMQAPMEVIGKKMEAAGKPMEALGKKMEALGKEMEKESHAADKVVRGLIQEALKSGLAKPAPNGAAG